MMSFIYLESKIKIHWGFSSKKLDGIASYKAFFYKPI